jgi:hypothetical protein
MEARVLNPIRNFKKSAIELRGSLPELERVWLVAQLRAKRCVTAAECDSRALVVEYDADRWRSTDLLDFLDDCAVPVAAIHDAHV